MVERDVQQIGSKSFGSRAEHNRGQAKCLSLIAASLILWTPLVGCSHSASTAYPMAGQPGSAPPPSYPTAAASIPPPSPPPDEYEQARASAYPSVTLADLFRRPPASPPAPPSPTATPPPGSAAPAGAGPSGSANPAAAASAPPHGAASAPAAASAPPNEQDEALAAAYPSVSLSDIFSGKSH